MENKGAWDCSCKAGVGFEIENIEADTNSVPSDVEEQVLQADNLGGQSFP